jgi:hypothetical protein
LRRLLQVGFDLDVRVDSSFRRIQRLMREYLSDINLVASLVFSQLPDKQPYRLAMDRTNWNFGLANIYILVHAIVYQGVAY